MFLKSNWVVDVYLPNMVLEWVFSFPVMTENHCFSSDLGCSRFIKRNRSWISLLTSGLYRWPSPSFSISSSQSTRSCISCNTRTKKQGHFNKLVHTWRMLFHLHSSIGSIWLWSSFATSNGAFGSPSMEKWCFRPLIFSCNRIFFKSLDSIGFGVNLKSWVC